ncbi:sensor domain-containing diguanylate cyclase [Psychrobium sp. 1_MG-2023]|uniref:sensor domain-containing diguanylate cyclase n=1 Tax=Psychrobium sp. 1_MG-2023 TaxID=3062624 RepID=UPI000C340818|nr:sensor domain-containing diguanylate cyclase [Psychrobium sp. 1_MG-2023]MDP2560675.1 sensor domain-containing diguanylate cyclase [Psychrobium sp. 1_MG-2023]PKF56571.1 diguanylate cyclase [Alteromonadales bacterium alter-6D02]
MNKSGLVLRLAIVIIFTAAAVGLISTQLFYSINYKNNLADGYQSIEQLHKTVSATASIATYLEDSELANEVINGLTSNDIINGAAINTSKLNISSKGYTDNENVVSFRLFSPFEQDREVGRLSIMPNLTHIRDQADAISFDNAVALTIEVTIISIITILVAFFVITRPILGIGKSLHNTVPGTDQRIKTPENHQQSELGVLVNDINKLLEKTEEQFFNERSLRNEVEVLENRFRMLFENATNPIALVESSGNILLYNQSFRELLTKLGLPLKKSYGPYLQDLFADKKLLALTVKSAFSNEEVATGEFELKAKNSDKSFWVQAVITATVSKDFKEYNQVTLHDISKRKQQIDRLSHKANYDKLTQLFNRQAAEYQLTQLINDGTPFAIILLDLNGFKPINDIYGHDAGDEILTHVASQIVKSLRKEDIASRWGGDEFVVVLPNVTSNEDIKGICKKLKQHIEKQHYLSNANKSVSVGASMGVAAFPDDQTTLEALIRSADQAMYRAKTKKSAEHYVSFSDEDTPSEQD